MWEHLGLPEPTAIQLDIAGYLQHGPKRMMVSAFRGVGKTWVTVAFVIWLLYCNPDLNILVVSASKTHADHFSTFCLRLLAEMPLLAHLRPWDGQRSSKIAFDVGPAKAAHAPSVKSAGITGQITGSRADVIVADDIEIPNNSATQTMRDKLIEIIKEFDSILKPVATARIVFLGTPQSEQTIYNALDGKTFETRIWTGRYPSPKQRRSLGAKLAPIIAKALDKNPELGTRYGDNKGAPVDPKRFTHEDLIEREASIGRSTFSLQFMLDTTLSDAERYPLKMHDLIVFDCAPGTAPVDIVWSNDTRYRVEDVQNVGFNGDGLFKPMMFSSDAWSEYQGIVMSLDPSGRGGDEVGYAVVAFHYGRLYVLDAGGLPGGYSDDTMVTICNIAKQWKVNKIIEEPNFGDGMFGALLRPHLARIYPCTMEETERSSAQKEQRIIDTLEPVMNQHRLVVNRSLFNKDYDSVNRYSDETRARYRLFYQLTRITRDRGSLAKDDRVDALALAVHYWTIRMDRDIEKAQAEHRAKLLDAELRKFAKHVLGRSNNGNPTWSSRNRRNR